jgi:DNA topoisomerase-1
LKLIETLYHISMQIRAIKYQRRKLRYGLFTMNKKYRKQEDLAEDESDIDDDWIAQYEDESREKEIEKARKKFDKDNEKRDADGEKPLEDDVLQGRIDKINEEYDRLKGERGSQDVEIKGKKSEESILNLIEKLDQRIKNEKFKREDKDKLKEVSLGTRYVSAFE